MLLHELPCRSARVELQGDQPAPHPDDQRFRGPGSVAGTQCSATEPVVAGLARLTVAARYLEVILDTVLGGHPRPSEGVRLEVSPFLQHERSVSCELNLASLGSGEDTDPVVLVSQVLTASAVVIKGLDGRHRVEIVLETSSGSLQWRQ